MKLIDADESTVANEPHKPNRPYWDLPEGVTRGTWDYLTSDSIANDYDEYFKDHQLLRFDLQLILEELEVPARTSENQTGRVATQTADSTDSGPNGPPWDIADLGCGTGRIIVELAERGWRGLAVDLSKKMLDVVRQKVSRQSLPIDTLQANLIDMQSIPSESCRHAVCMFSTLGMIHGARYRAQAIRESARILKPQGKFILQVHNYWNNLRFPGGIRWMIQNWWQSSILKSDEMGDRYYPYRGIPKMYLHLFRWREIASLLNQAGLTITRVVPLQGREIRPLPFPFLFGSIRSTGWIIVCLKRI